MKKIIGAIIFLGLVGVVVGIFYSHQSTDNPSQASQTKKAKYHCPMHPNFTSDKPGTCAICGMDLVKDNDDPQDQPSLNNGNKERKILFYRNPMDPSITSPTFMKDSMGMDYVPVYEEAKTSPPGVAINMERQQLIGVQKDTVKKRSLSVEITTVGKVAYDPDLYVTQEEFLQALKTAAASENSSLESMRQQSQELVTFSERKLFLMGMSKAEIEALKKSGTAQDNLYFPGNSGKAWIYITVYEYELGLVKEGQEVSVDAIAYPGKVFKGKITALTPILNAESRSVRVRAEVVDQEGILKPEMFVNAHIYVNLGNKLAIPEEAVINSGTRNIVYVIGNNRFVMREVVLGAKANGYYEVISGLNEGEEIVTSGDFLIDAESKLKGAW